MMTGRVHSSDTCNYFSYFLQKSRKNEIQMSSFCTVREVSDMRLSIQFMVALMINRSKWDQQTLLFWALLNRGYGLRVWGFNYVLFLLR